jgi:hypothetical protein
MRLFLCVVVAMSLLSLFNGFSRADDKKDVQTVTGILIDQHCGEKMMKKDDPEAAAAEHTKSCATADACAASGYCVITGKHMLKFDDAGNKLAKDFLAKTDKEKDLKVTVTGMVHDDQIDVTSLKDAAEK